jgi:hypothetical protein
MAYSIVLSSVINGHNLRKASRQVLSNKDSAGIECLPLMNLPATLIFQKMFK